MISKVCITRASHIGVSSKASQRRNLMASRSLLRSTHALQSTAHLLGGRTRLFQQHPEMRPSVSPYGIRTMAMSSRDDDKSWAEVAGEAAGALKSVVKKAVSTVKKVVGQDEATKIERQRQKEREELYKPPDLGGLFGGGIMGRAAGAMLGSAIKAVGQEMAKAGEAAENLRSRAAAAIENDPAVLSAMGGRVQVGNPISTSSMTSSINGRSTQQTTLVLPVSGPAGMAQAQVQASEGHQGSEGTMTIVVQTMDGRVLQVSESRGGGSSGRGRVIDAEWKDV